MSADSWWRKVESVLESDTVYRINAVLMVLTIAGIIGYVAWT